MDVCLIQMSLDIIIIVLLVLGVFFALGDQNRYNAVIASYVVDKDRLSVPPAILIGEAELIYRSLTMGSPDEGLIVNVFSNKNEFDISALNHYYGVRINSAANQGWNLRQWLRGNLSVNGVQRIRAMSVGSNLDI